MAMAVRLFEMHRILKNTGSIYLHCDPTASHYLKLVMDSIFRKENFRNEIVWQRNTGLRKSKKKYGSIHDTLLFYVKNKDRSTWNLEYEEYTKDCIENYYRHSDLRGQYSIRSPLMIPNKGNSKNEAIQPWNGIDPAATRRIWNVPHTTVYAKYIEDNFIPDYRQITSIHARLDALDKADLIYYPPKGTVLGLKKYLDGSPGYPPQDIITNVKRIYSSSKECTGYPKQKPLALLERIIKVSSNKSDIVLDPFCGCATACVAAEKLGRKWIGIDISDSAEVITKLRLEEEITNKSDFWDPIKDIIVTSIPPILTNPLLKKQSSNTELFNKTRHYNYSDIELQTFQTLSLIHI